MKTMIMFIITCFVVTAGAHAQHLIVGDSSAVVLRNGAYMSVDILKVSDGGAVLVDESSLLRTGSAPRVTEVPEYESQSGVPNTFALLQNYPNPFNPTTVINFHVPFISYVILKVYNTLGQEVGTLVNTELPPGTHKSTWDATGYPSGVYFYRIIAGKYTETKKLLLLR